MNINGVVKANAADILMNFGTDVASSTEISATKSDFSTVLDQAKTDSSEEVKESTVNKPKTEGRDNIDKAVSNLNKKLKNISDASEEDLTEELNELTDEIKNSISEVLNISVEELEEAMENLGIGVVDLLDPSKVMELIVEVSDATAPVEVVMDADLSAAYKSINQQINDAVDTFAKENDLTTEDVKQKLSEFEDSLNEQISKASDVDSFVTKDVTDASKSEGFKEQSNDKGTDSNTNHSPEMMADKIRTNLNEAITEAFAVDDGEFLVDTDDVLRQVNESIRVNLTPDSKSLEIQLNPQNLGQVTVQVVSRGGVVSANVAAENEAVKKVLELSLNTLKENLNNQGIKVEDVEVTLAKQAFSEQQEREAREENRRGSRRRASLEDNEVEEVNEEVKSSDNIINYRA